MDCIAGSRCAASFSCISLAKYEEICERHLFRHGSQNLHLVAAKGRRTKPRTFLDIYRGRKTKSDSRLFRRELNLEEY